MREWDLSEWAVFIGIIAIVLIVVFLFFAVVFDHFQQNDLIRECVKSGRDYFECYSLIKGKR